MSLPSVRTLLFGIACGWILSALRAPLGLDLTQVPAVSGSTTVLFRAAALFALAVLLDARRPAFERGVRPLAVLPCAALGFALHALFVAPLWTPSTRAGYAVLLLASTGLAWLVVGRARGESPPIDEERPGGRERLGLVVVGCGAAVALENVARHLRLFGAGLPEDDAVVGFTLLVGLAVGALAFGLPFARPGGYGVLAAGGGVATAAATIVGLSFLSGMEPNPYYTYLNRFGLDLTLAGTWSPTALIAGGAWIIPAFAGGAALVGARHPARTTALLTGAAVGLLAMPHLVRSLSEPLAFPLGSRTPWAWLPCALGTLTAATGAMIALPGNTSRRGLLTGIALSAAAVAAVVFGPRTAVWSLSPWYITTIDARLVLHTPEGLVTVEVERGGEPAVTLDRRLLTPVARQVELDLRRLQSSVALLAPERRAAARMLFVGQMTPSRQRALAQIGTVDRTAPWYDALEAVEAFLFRGEPVSGERLAPQEARRRIADGSYDLVVVAPGQGPLVRMKALLDFPWGTSPAPAGSLPPLPPGTVGVVWLDGASQAYARPLAGRAILAQDGLKELSLGWVLGDVVDQPSPERPAFLPLGSPRPRPNGWRTLTTRPNDRPRRDRAQLAARLRDASAGGERAELTEGLALHFGAQRPSSPFESMSQQIEIDEEALRSFLRAAQEGPLDAFERSLWESIAALLADKRRIDLVLVYVEPVAERYTPWLALDRAVARAYEEYNMPAEARRALERNVDDETYDIGLLSRCARLALLAGDAAGAVVHLERALAIQPGRYELERGLGIAQVHAGEPQGRALLRRLATEHPEDEGLLPYLEEGAPLPELDPAFLIGSDSEHDHGS